MNHRVLLIFLACLLSACGLRETPPAPLLAIADGRYQATIEGVCVTLEFGRRQSVVLDAGCDGQAEGQTGFEVIENVIQSDLGSFTVNAVGAVSFSGVWAQGGALTEARFTRI